MTSPLRVVLDVNIFVRLVKGQREHRIGTAAQRIFSALEAGQMCGRQAQIVASHRMIDTLSNVLQRLSVPAQQAEAERAEAEGWDAFMRHEAAKRAKAAG